MKKIEEIGVKKFARRIAEVMLDLKSSHCWFIIQQALDPKGLMSWTETETILQNVIKETKNFQSDQAEIKRLTKARDTLQKAFNYRIDEISKLKAEIERLRELLKYYSISEELKFRF